MKRALPQSEKRILLRGSADALVAFSLGAKGPVVGRSRRHQRRRRSDPNPADGIAKLGYAPAELANISFRPPARGYLQSHRAAASDNDINIGRAAFLQPLSGWGAINVPAGSPAALSGGIQPGNDSGLTAGRIKCIWRDGTKPAPRPMIVRARRRSKSSLTRRPEDHSSLEKVRH